VQEVRPDRCTDIGRRWFDMRAPHLRTFAEDARPYLRMIIERMFPSLPVLSHVEIVRGAEIRSLGTIS